MLVYLEKFKRLPDAIKARVAGPEAMRSLESLEKKYDLKLAVAVMKVAVKDLPLGELPHYLRTEGLRPASAETLAEVLKNRIFKDILPYLGETSAPETLAAVVEPITEIIPVEAEETEKIKIPVEVIAPIVSAPAPEPEITAEPEVSEEPEAEPQLEPEEEPIMVSILPPTDVSKEKNLEETEDIFLSAADQLSSGSGLPDIYTLQVEACLEETLKADFGLNPGDSEIHSALEAPLRLYLRGIRSKIDTRITMNQPVTEGGLGLPDEIVNRIFKVLEDNKRKIIKENRVWSPHQSSATLEKLRSLDIPVVDTIYDLAARLDIRHELPMPTPGEPAVYIAPENVQKPPAPVPPVVKIKINEAPPVVPVAPAPKPVRHSFLGMFGKIKMQDIKTVKIMSPVDELLYLDLVNFRRLGNDPRAITDKLLAKIKLLEKDGYDKLIAGVRAWRQSPVNKMYLALTGESAQASRPLKEILELHKQNNQETLTQEELDAIIDLNKQLNF
jgi:hypothetical protein